MTLTAAILALYLAGHHPASFLPATAPTEVSARRRRKRHLIIKAHKPVDPCAANIWFEEVWRCRVGDWPIKNIFIDFPPTAAGTSYTDTIE